MSNALYLIGSNLLTAALAGMAVWLLCRTRMLRQRPALCHGLWFLVLLKLVVPAFIPVSVLSATHTDRHNKIATAANSGEATSGKTKSSIELGQEVDSIEDPTSQMATTSPETIKDASGSLSVSSGATFSVASRATFIALLGVSLLGTLALWQIALRQLQQVSRLLKGSVDQPCREVNLLREVALRFNRSNAPTLQIVDARIAPMLWAELGNPKIILPRQLAGSLNDGQLRSIIAHEFAHFVRGDHWFNLFAFFVTTLFWWNPVAWIARRELIASAEACCDALAVEKLAGSRKSYAETLLAVVNYVSSAQVLRPTLSVTFGESQALRRRFEVLANAGIASRVSRVGWVVLAIICAVSALSPIRAKESEVPKPSASGAETKPDASTSPENAAKQASEQATKHYITGIVFEKKTRKPIADATVNIHVEAEQEPEKRGLSGVTDADGRYRIEVPLGSVRLWFPRLKPGYWLEQGECIKPLVTTPSEPIVTHDITANMGIAWPLRVVVEGGIPSGEKMIVSITEVEDDTKRHAWLKGSPVSFEKPFNSSISSLGTDGIGTFTQCGESGEFVVSVGVSTGGAMTELIVDPGFEIGKVKSIAPVAGTDKTILTDESGATATIGKAEVTLQNGLPLLTFKAASLTPTWTQEVTGQILDMNGNPIDAARVGAVTGVEGGGSGDTGVFATTDSKGRFALNLRLSESMEQQHLNLVITKDGYAGFDSPKIALPKKTSPTIHAGQFTLKPGHSLAIRTLNADGKALPGATVEPQGDYAQRRQAIRTDSQGRGVLTDLPAGVVRVHAKYGSLFLQSQVVIDDTIDVAEETELKLIEPTPSRAAK